jgi:Zn-dependent oligopeptidase
VETVFHAFGHALQHMLTKKDEGLVAGIRGIEWDELVLPQVRKIFIFIFKCTYRINLLVKTSKED